MVIVPAPVIDGGLAGQKKAAAPKPPPDPAKARLEAINQQLAEAQQCADALKTNPQNTVEKLRLRQICREVIDLYDDEPKDSPNPFAEGTSKDKLKSLQERLEKKS